MPPVISVS